jgi:hypothetical protein
MVNEKHDDGVPTHVGRCQVSTGSLIVTYEVGGSLETVQTLRAEDERRCWYCGAIRVIRVNWHTAIGTTEIISNLHEAFRVELGKVVDVDDAFCGQLCSRRSRNTHLVGFLKECCCLSQCKYHRCDFDLFRVKEKKK